jgi:ferric-dicitrate binding protein FerR (iron transport regulator)
MRVFGHTIATWLFLAATSVVCLAQNPFTSSERVAKVSTLTGRVSILRDQQEWALHVGDPIRVRQMIVTGSDGFATFDVSDGSTFEVFPNSRVIFRDNPSNWKDLLDLLIGRVKVHIEKLGGKPNPTSVTAPTAVISVRGTTFDVVAEDEDLTIVSVEEGEVAVRHVVFAYNPEVTLHPGDSIRVYRNQPLAQRSIDKSRGIHIALRAAAEAIYQVIYRTPSGGGGGTGPVPTPTGGTNGDSTGTKPPPPPPPPPPPK